MAVSKVFKGNVYLTGGASLYVNGVLVIDGTGTVIPVIAPVTTTTLTVTGNSLLGDNAAVDTTTMRSLLSLEGVTTIATSVKLQFRDTGIYLYSANDGYLDVVADTGLRIAANSVATGTFAIVSASASSFAVGLAGATNPAFVVDSSTGSQAGGLKVTGSTAAGTVAIAAISSGADVSLSIAAKGVGNLKLANPKMTHTPTAQNTTATLTAAQVATGYITSTSAAGVSLTLPSGTDLGAALGAVQGTIHELYIDNTAGANTVTIIAGTNGVLSTAGVDTAGSFGDLTVASGVTGQARFTIMFSSATAYTFTRTA